jgi:hypothetical protein
MKEIANGRVNVACDHKPESDAHGSSEEVNRCEIEAHNQNTIGYRLDR